MITLVRHQHDATRFAGCQEDALSKASGDRAGP